MDRRSRKDLGSRRAYVMVHCNIQPELPMTFLVLILAAPAAVLILADMASAIFETLPDCQR